MGVNGILLQPQSTKLILKIPFPDEQQTNKELITVELGSCQSFQYTSRRNIQPFHAIGSFLPKEHIGLARFIVGNLTNVVINRTMYLELLEQYIKYQLKFSVDKDNNVFVNTSTMNKYQQFNEYIEQIKTITGVDSVNKYLQWLIALFKTRSVTELGANESTTDIPKNAESSDKTLVQSIADKMSISINIANNAGYTVQAKLNDLSDNLKQSYNEQQQYYYFPPVSLEDFPASTLEVYEPLYAKDEGSNQYKIKYKKTTLYGVEFMTDGIEIQAGQQQLFQRIRFFAREVMIESREAGQQ